MKIITLHKMFKIFFRTRTNERYSLSMDKKSSFFSLFLIQKSLKKNDL